MTFGTATPTSPALSPASQAVISTGGIGSISTPTSTSTRTGTGKTVSPGNSGAACSARPASRKGT